MISGWGPPDPPSPWWVRNRPHPKQLNYSPKAIKLQLPIVMRLLIVSSLLLDSLSKYTLRKAIKQDTCLFVSEREAEVVWCGRV